MTMASDVANIAQTISESLLDLPIVPGDDVLLDEETRVTCVVQLHGAFEGAVMIECPDTLADRLTAALLQATAAPSSEEIVDALGELANMFAGNLKALLARPSVISLPMVFFGPQDDALGEVTVVARVPFVCDGEPFVVTIFQH